MAMSPSSSHGGGFTAVSCVLGRDATLDIRTVGDHPILWDALYDNLSDFTPLVALPSGLGLSFAHDGSASTITTTTAGIWSFTYTLARAPDAAWTGGIGTATATQSWLAEDEVFTEVLALATGTALPQVISTGTQATGNPYVLANGYISIVRLG